MHDTVNLSFRRVLQAGEWVFQCRWREREELRAARIRDIPQSMLDRKRHKEEECAEILATISRNSRESYKTAARRNNLPA